MVSHDPDTPIFARQGFYTSARPSITDSMNHWNMMLNRRAW